MGATVPAAGRRVPAARGGRAAFRAAPARRVARGRTTDLAASAPDLAALRPALPDLPAAQAGLDAEQRPDVRESRARVLEAQSAERLSRRVVEAPDLV